MNSCPETRLHEGQLHRKLNDENYFNEGGPFNPQLLMYYYLFIKRKTSDLPGGKVESSFKTTKNHHL